ncbi:MAG: DUF456 domain-containing protein [Chloroflexi bacterium]|nr:DUF456 domain-containing protein [Chloroflexota bacterium]
MPFNLYTNPAAQLTLLLILVGLVGAIVPVVPGSLFIWLGILAWAIGEHFQRFDWVVLTVLGLLALLATFSEYWLRPLVQYRAGFGWKNIGAAIVGGFIGGFLLSEIPVLGTLVGAALGSLLGTAAVTYLEKRNFRQAWRAAQTYLVGCALSTAVEVAVSLVMLAIFVWRAFF